MLCVQWASTRVRVYRAACKYPIIRLLIFDTAAATFDDHFLGQEPPWSRGSAVVIVVGVVDVAVVIVDAVDVAVVVVVACFLSGVILSTVVALPCLCR